MLDMFPMQIISTGTITDGNCTHESFGYKRMNAVIHFDLILNLDGEVMKAGTWSKQGDGDSWKVGT